LDVADLNNPVMGFEGKPISPYCQYQSYFFLDSVFSVLLDGTIVRLYVDSADSRKAVPKTIIKKGPPFVWVCE
jgi:hypothetical protein